MTTTCVLPRSGWTVHSEQSDEAALRVGAWGITTELVSGVVVMSRRAKHSFMVCVFDKNGGPDILQGFLEADRAKREHYHYVTLLVDYGRIIYDPCF